MRRYEEALADFNRAIALDENLETGLLPALVAFSAAGGRYGPSIVLCP